MTSAEEQPDEGKTSLTAKIRGLGAMNFSMNTDALVRKAGALSLISQVSDRMGKTFAPYVEPVLEVVKEHIAFQYNKEIRKYSLRAFKSLLEASGDPSNIQIF